MSNPRNILHQTMELDFSDDQDNPLNFWNKPDEFENEKDFEYIKLDVEYKHYILNDLVLGKWQSWRHIEILSVKLKGMEVYPLLYSLNALDFIKDSCRQDIEHKIWYFELRK